MSFLHVIGFGFKVGHLLLMLCCWFVSVISMNWVVCDDSEDMGTKTGFFGDSATMWMDFWWKKISGNSCKIHHHCYHYSGGSKRVRLTWWRKLLVIWIIFSTIVAFSVFWYMSSQAAGKRKETLASMCDERARILQDQFNVSMNHVQAMSILISTFHHGKDPSAIDQRTFARYTERTAFERPLTSGVAYAVRVLQSEREQFEKQQGWTIKQMDTLEGAPVRKGKYNPEVLEPSPVQEEYAPVIFAQETVSHVISIDMLSGKEDRENVLRARASGKGVLTAPFRLLKSNHLGVILTFAVYKTDLPSNATPNERIQATDGYLGGIFDMESLVEKLLQQLASKQIILVNVYDITNSSHPISMYGSEVSNDGLQHTSGLNFGDPFRKHEMHCRFKQKAPWPWMAIMFSIGILVIMLLVGYTVYATVSRFVKVEDDYHEMMELKKRAEAADVAKSQFLATVSHEIRTPMNGVLGMLHMLMDTNLDVTQQDYVRTAQGSGKALVSLVNAVLDQAKIESGKLELDIVQFSLRAIMDEVLSLFSGKSQDKGLELAAYISEKVPEKLIGDPGRFRQIIINLMGNSIKFTEKGHIFVTVHLLEEVMESIEVETESSPKSTLSGFPVADRRQSWAGFKTLGENGLASLTLPSSDLVNIIVSVEDTGVGIPFEAQPRIFTPFVQVGPSISRTHGGTGIGLSISKCLVGLMNGEIGFSSLPKVGSTFTFTAVLTNDCSSQPEVKDQQIDKPSSSASSVFEGMKALVVDPRPVRAMVSRYHFRRLGIQAEEVPDLNQCFSSLSIGNSRIDVVLIEEEVWDKDLALASQFVEKLNTFDQNISPKLFLLSNAIRTRCATSALATPTVILKPLRASTLASSLQLAIGVGNKVISGSKEPPGVVLRDLLRGRKILVVDDNSVNLRVAAGALKKYGADVVCADSGKKAIELLKPPHRFDACFMDIQMPEIDGFEATKRIRDMEQKANIRILQGEVSEARENKTEWHLPILAMTADVIQATHEECLRCGMDGYVSKPFEAEQLYREVSRFFHTTVDQNSQ